MIMCGRTSARPFIGAASALVLLAACSGAPGDPVVVRDSAGVAITLSTAPAWPAEDAWHLAPEPRQVVGGLAGQRLHAFTSATDARVIDRDRVLVTNCSNPPEVRLFDASGGHLQTFGGMGTAEGRCRFILRTWTAGDTLIIYDPTLARLTYFDLRGRVHRTLPVPTGPESLVWVDRFADGSLLGRPSHPLPVEDGRTRARFAYSRLYPAEQVVEPIVEVLGAEFVVSGTGSPHPIIEQVLFAPFTTAAVHGRALYLSDTRDFWIEERDQDGILHRRFGRTWDPEPIRSGFIRAYREQRLRAAGGEVRAVRQELERAVFASRFPAHDPSMLVDATGHVWVLHVAIRPGEERLWSVFAPDGRWLGEVSTPNRLRVTSVGTDHVIGVWQDSHGVPTVRVFDLVKPATRAPAPPNGQGS
jgi:hypothetical protein